VTRYVVLDTETTGLDPKQGHRIIEVAGVEGVARQVTGRYFHRYVNPEREVDPGATEVHGMTWEDLRDKPRFSEISGELLDFIGGAQLVIHNAPFDVAFLDAELGLLELPEVTRHCAGVLDTLRMAREQFPGKRNNLDALCERLQVEHSHRTLHGALLDARLLAEVYLAMTRGQESLVMDVAPEAGGGPAAGGIGRRPARVIPASAAELAQHQAALRDIDRESGGRCLWLAGTGAGEG
jgi:DNA polymerase-3 subunit epsilon